MSSLLPNLPANIDRLLPWGWSDDLTQYWQNLDASLRSQFRPARIVEDPRGAFLLQGISLDESPVRAEVIGQLRKADLLWPSVGDWVLADQSPSPMIHRVLPRKGLLQRKAAGESEDIQALAANIDCALIVTSPNHDLSPRRIERMLLAIREANAAPLLVLNKCDLISAEQTQSLIEDLRDRLNQLSVVAVSARSGDGLSGLLSGVRALCSVAQPTIALLGSSGVGKSTLTNALLGEDAQRTSEVRSDDSKGRHTTTGRRLLRTPHQLLMIDMPGVREFQLADPENSLEGRLDEEFSDIQELALRCRFTNCSHEREPGCQIRLALDQGALAADRVHSWRKLLGEIADRRQPKKSLGRTSGRTRR